LQKFSYLKSSNASYIDALFERYSEDPDSVDPSWRYFFEGLELSTQSPLQTDKPSTPAGASTEVFTPELRSASSLNLGMDLGSEAKVFELIMAYREFGKHLANVNPLSPPPLSYPQLELSRFGLTLANLSQTFAASRLIGMDPSKLSDLIARLKETYCKSVGAEFAHIQNLNERQWLQTKMESNQYREKLDSETRKFILRRITESETFERFLHTRYVAQKRFSIEGAETLIPSLDCIIEKGSEMGVQEFIVGMAHRGRLNVLTHIFGKKPEFILTEFEGAYPADLSLGSGDVKYHMGYSADVTTRAGKKAHLSLASNPSHLEFVNPVIEGIARAKQIFLGDPEGQKVIPITIHGDAAFAGQGVCYETLNLSLLTGYATGGTIHFIINNQVGFTTSPVDSRSTLYCTDVAKMLDSPIFHVNGDDPEALWFISQLCVEYRQKFKKDCFIDIVCYRKHGHNEGDEPSFTQPVLYQKIKAHPSPKDVYAQKLTQEQIINPEAVGELVQKFTDQLIAAQTFTKKEAPKPSISAFEGRWKTFRRPQPSDLFEPVQTAVPEAHLKKLASQINLIPSGFHLHSKLNRFFEARAKAVEEGKGIDWGNGEALAYATLLQEGHSIRLSGQDVERGTFTHRHCVLNDVETGEKYTPFHHLGEGQGKFHVHNSHLSETGVLGFEYGYSLADPHTLVIWEAQFGDFSNGAQVIIDQFIASSESKWQRVSGLTLLLPHGFEGQGPEHSSARLERFLQLCGQNNLFVCNFTTPAQIFHALRRQVKWNFRKPLVIMSPKSLLRHPLAISSLQEFSNGKLEEVLDDPAFQENSKADSAKKVLLCSGKIYYDLITARAAGKLESGAQQVSQDIAPSVAVVRVEQLYPWPEAKLAQILARYKNASVVWVQEEPRNMGAWSHVFNLWSGGTDFFQAKAGNRPIQYVGREVSAAPAVGSHKIHEHEQEALIQKALS